MLDEIIVSNLGLIEHAALAPGPGLTVITGETGTGKTVMLGALRLLMGEQAPKGLIGPHKDEADVSARFTDGEEIVVRRVVTRTKSKAYLDGAISTAGALKQEIGARVAIVGQHDQHRITSSAGMRQLIDSSLTTKERASLDVYADAWSTFENVRAEADRLGSDHRGLTRELETLRFQMEEIADAAFEVGDEHELQVRANRLRNAGALAETVDQTLRLLGDEGSAQFLTDASRALNNAAEMDGSLNSIASQVADVTGSLSEATAELVRYSSDLDIDSGALQDTEQRIALLSSLKRKYGESIESILSFAKDALEREAELAEMLDAADSIAQRLSASETLLADAGDVLRNMRRTAGHRIAKNALQHLKELGFSAPLVEIDIATAEPSSHGADAIAVLFSSDDTLSLGPVSAIASGGELSRLVLALTLASGSADSEVIAFDEIDTGIGGETALAMGKKLSSLAVDRQVICVTHLPQVAAFADKHYVVTRSGNIARINESAGEDRTTELARMLAGLSESQKGREHARELEALAAKRKSGGPAR